MMNITHTTLGKIFPPKRVKTKVETEPVEENTMNELEPKETKSEPKRKGRKPGSHYLKPMDMEQYISDRDCLHIFVEHPDIAELKLVENPYLRNSLARASFQNKTIEISSKVMLDNKSVQRDVFIKALCHFIAIKLFNEVGQGEAYKLLVQRYARKTKKSIEPKSRLTIQEENKVTVA